jgi:hypothetical protein
MEKVFEETSFLVRCQAGEEGTDSDEGTEHFGAGRQTFIILAHTTASTQPGPRASP